MRLALKVQTVQAATQWYSSPRWATGFCQNRNMLLIFLCDSTATPSSPLDIWPYLGRLSAWKYYRHQWKQRQGWQWGCLTAGWQHSKLLRPVPGKQWVILLQKQWAERPWGLHLSQGGALQQAGDRAAWVGRRCCPDVTGRPQTPSITEHLGSTGASAGGARGRAEKWEGAEEVFNVIQVPLWLGVVPKVVGGKRWPCWN